MRIIFQQGCGGAEVVGPAQEGLDLGGEHVQVKGLGHEVVAAHVHGHDDVHVVRRVQFVTLLCYALVILRKKQIKRNGTNA